MKPMAQGASVVQNRGSITQDNYYDSQHKGAIIPPIKMGWLNFKSSHKFNCIAKGEKLISLVLHVKQKNIKFNYVMNERNYVLYKN